MSIYYKWSKEFLEAGKRRLAGDTARAASTGEVTALRRETRDLKEVVAEQTGRLVRPLPAKTGLSEPRTTARKSNPPAHAPIGKNEFQIFLPDPNRVT
jgi:hypothetical protein